MRGKRRIRLAACAGALASLLVGLPVAVPAADPATDAADSGWPELRLDLRLPGFDDSPWLDPLRLLGGAGLAERASVPLRVSASVSLPQAGAESAPASRTGVGAASLMRERMGELQDLSAQRPGIARPAGIGLPAAHHGAASPFAPRAAVAGRGRVGMLGGLASLSSVVPGTAGSLLGLRRQHDRSTAVMGRVDAAPLPFLDLYGMFGWSTGELGVDTRLRDSMSQPGASMGLSEQVYKAMTYGAGGRLSGSWEQFYATIDTKFTFTDVDIADEPFRTFSVAPRVGARSDSGPVKGTFYLGAMYMTVDDDVKAGIDIPGLNGVPLQLDMDITKPWNMLVGTEIEIVENFVFSIEGGFLGRRQVVAGFGAKF